MTIKNVNTEKHVVRKLNEDDMLEILIEHYITSTGGTRGLILGTPGVDLRFIGVWSSTSGDKVLSNMDLNSLDKEIDFTGYHSYLERHTECHITPEKLKVVLQQLDTSELSNRKEEE